MKLLFCLLLAMLPLVFSQGGVITCGGFVETSQSLAKVLASYKFDYSAVQIKLFTSEGLLKYTAECAPNGYYFIPIYDNAQYVLKIEGPQGWSFEPSQTEFTVSENENGCENDINFIFTGFRFNGQVTGAAAADCDSTSQPAGVHLSLLTEDGKTLDTALSDNQGKFSFKNVFLGKYVIHAAHPQWSITPTQQAVEIKFSNSEIPQPFHVTGYSLSGKVTAFEQPIADVDMFLFVSESIDTNLACSVSSSSAPKLDGQRLVCKTETDENGKFTFSDLPCGQYTVVPFYQKGSTKFDINPSQLEVSLKHDSMLLASDFQILGFSVQGRVVDSEGKPFAGVSITIDEERTTVTNQNGVYFLDRVKAGKHSVKASLAHYEFSELSNVVLSPSSSSFPDIKVVKYELCGNADVDESVVIELLDSKKQLLKSIETDHNGDFCFLVSPASYQIKPRGKTLLSPPEYDLKRSGQAALNLRFLQTRVSVSGEVQCMESPCESSLKVILSRSESDKHEMSLDENNRFSFENMRPGRYVLSVEKEWWCFDKKSIDLELFYDDIKDIRIVHNGFAVQTRLSHPSSVQIGLVSDASTATTDIEAGMQRLCVPKAGKYRLTPMSCMKFQQSEFFFDTEKPTVVEMTATHFLTEGHLLFETTEDVTKHQLEITVQAGQDKQVVSASKIDADASLLKQLIRETKSPAVDLVVFKYSFWATPSTTYTISPTSSYFLFYPQTQSFSLASSVCPSQAPAFVSRKGMFLSGSIDPAIADVRITVLSNGKEVKSTMTDKKGLYTVGPLYDNQQYSVSARATGFVLVESTPGNFKAMQLSEINVLVKDQDGNVLPEVLLSLTGKGYRSNNATIADGTFVFTDLYPGSYYLRPIYKEYVFEPKFQSFDIEEAVKKHQVFTATRVAYSVFGSVRSLTGEPQASIFVEAVSKKEQKVIEDTQTDASGEFRIRGLPPHNDYSIRVKNSNTQLEGSSPQSISVSMKAEDIKNVNFVAFSQLGKFDLTGSVNSSDEWLSTLRVELVRASSQFSVLRSVSLSKEFPFFQFPSLPAGDYIVKCRTSLSPLTHQFDMDSQMRVELKDHVDVTLKFEASEKQFNQEMTKSSLISVVVATIVVFAVIYRDQIQQSLQAFVNRPQQSKPKKR